MQSNGIMSSMQVHTIYETHTVAAEYIYMYIYTIHGWPRIFQTHAHR